MSQLDPFRQKRAPGIADRFHNVRDRHQRQERAMWLGSLLLEFDEFELEVLHGMGFLAIRDYDMLKKASHAFPAEEKEASGLTMDAHAATLEN